VLPAIVRERVSQLFRLLTGGPIFTKEKNFIEGSATFTGAMLWQLLGHAVF